MRINPVSQIRILKRSWSAEYLATMLSVSEQAVRAWSVGRSFPDASNIKKIDKFFEFIMGDVRCRDCKYGYPIETIKEYRCFQGCQAGIYSKQVEEDRLPCEYFDQDKETGGKENE